MDATSPQGGKRGRGRGNSGRGRGGRGRGGRGRGGRGAGNASSPSKQKAPIFEQHLTPEEIQQGLQAGTLHQGKLRINSKNYEDCYVKVAGFDIDVSVPSFPARNRAMVNDIVALELLPKNAWRLKTNEVKAAGLSVQYDHEESLSNALSDLKLGYSSPKKRRGRDQSPAKRMIKHGVGSQASPSSSTVIRRIEDMPEEFLQPVAKVVGIIERKPVQIPGALQPFSKAYAKVQPRDMRMPVVLIPMKTCPPEFHANPEGFSEQQLVLAEVTGWLDTSMFAKGKLLQVVGPAGSIEAETASLLLANAIPTDDFEDDVLACLPDIPDSGWEVPQEEIKNRRDLRETRIFSIDPPTAKDLDDAMHCTKLDNGNYEIGVHIADVSYFIQPGSALDQEARRRATTTYIVQKAYPMLPPLLCEDLCSLNENVDRLCFSVIWELDKNAKPVSEWIGRTIIRSCGKLAYGHAQSVIDGDTDAAFPELEIASKADVQHDIITLNGLARILRQQRLDNGCLELQKGKAGFQLDPETMSPQACYVHEQREANQLIQEFMLLANISVAKFVYNTFQDSSLLRCHPEPLDKKLTELIDMYKSIGVEINGESAGTLAASVRAYAESSSALNSSALQALLSQPMVPAEYVCSSSDKAVLRHYALSVPLYTHFTSPIRRYPDLVTHRILQCALDARENPHASKNLYDSDEVIEIAAICNERRASAKKAQDASADLFAAIYIQDKGPIEGDAVVTNVLDRSFDVYMPSMAYEGRIRMDSLPTEEYNYDIAPSWKSGGRFVIRQLTKLRVSLSSQLEKGVYKVTANAVDGSFHND